MYVEQLSNQPRGPTFMQHLPQAWITWSIDHVANQKILNAYGEKRSDMANASWVFTIAWAFHHRSKWLNDIAWRIIIDDLQLHELAMTHFEQWWHIQDGAFQLITMTQVMLYMVTWWCGRLRDQGPNEWSCIWAYIPSWDTLWCFSVSCRQHWTHSLLEKFTSIVVNC